MGDEVISFWIGQCGVQIGDAVWELLCLEHEMSPEGKFMHGSLPDDHSFVHFFQETQHEQFVPRCIFVDLEPNVVDEIRTGVYRKLFHPEYLIDSMEDASSNFARGFYKCGKAIMKQMIEATRKVVEESNKVQAFILNHSFGGGTGSGFSSLLMEYLSLEFEKITKAQLGIFPSPKMTSSVVEPYNTVLSIQIPMEIADLSMFADNESMYEICCSKLNVDQPVFTNLNRLLAQVFSGLTASFRFEGPIAARLIDLQTNLVPYPRIHFPLIGFAPLESHARASHETLSTREITQAVFQRANQLVSVDPESGIYIAVANLFRGDVTPVEINNAIVQLKMNKKLQFVQWCPTGFKTSINYQPMTVVPPSRMAYSIRSLTNLINTTAIKQIMGDLRFKFNCIFARRAFVHWYISEGLEEGEFDDAQGEIVTMERDLIELERRESAVDDGDVHIPAAPISKPLRSMSSDKTTSNDYKPPPGYNQNPQSTKKPEQSQRSQPEESKMKKYEDEMLNELRSSNSIPTESEQSSTNNENIQPRLVQQKPTQQKPMQQKPAQQKSAQQKPAQQKPSSQQPTKQQPTPQQPMKQQPAPQQPTKQQPAPQQHAPQQPAPQQPTKQQPALKPNLKPQEPSKKAPQQQNKVSEPHKRQSQSQSQSESSSTSSEMSFSESTSTSDDSQGDENRQNSAKYMHKSSKYRYRAYNIEITNEHNTSFDNPKFQIQKSDDKFKINQFLPNYNFSRGKETLFSMADGDDYDEDDDYDDDDDDKSSTSSLISHMFEETFLSDDDDYDDATLTTNNTTNFTKNPTEYFTLRKYQKC